MAHVRLGGTSLVLCHFPPRCTEHNMIASHVYVTGAASSAKVHISGFCVGSNLESNPLEEVIQIMNYEHLHTFSPVQFGFLSTHDQVTKLARWHTSKVFDIKPCSHPLGLWTR